MSVRLKSLAQLLKEKISPSIIVKLFFYLEAKFFLNGFMIE